MDLLRTVERLHQGIAVTALTGIRGLWLMVTDHVVVPLGLLHMHRLHRWFANLRLDPKKH